MKKLVYSLFALAVVAGVASCSSNGQKSDNAADSAADSTVQMVFVGTTPAADADGFANTLTMTYTGADKGTYTLDQTVIGGDSTAVEAVSFSDQGDFAVETKDGQKYLKLTSTADTINAQSTYFMVPNDSTIVMVNSDYELPVRPEDYTLKLSK